MRRKRNVPDFSVDPHPTCEQFCLPEDEVSWMAEIYHGGVLAFMAVGYWQALDEARREHLIEDVTNRIGEQEFVVVTAWDTEDGIQKSRKRMTTSVVVRDIIEHDWDEYTQEDLATVSTVDDLERIYQGVMDVGGAHLASFLSVAEAERREKEREMKRLEGIAHNFAHSCGQQFGTFDFLRALEQRIQRVRDDRADFNSGEARMERWMDTRYAGLGAETFFDDGNFENGRYQSQIEDLEDVLEWLEHECPLLMAKYQEMKLAGTWAEEEETLEV